MRVTRRPNLLEIRLRSGNDLEAVHRDKHQHTLGLLSGRCCYIAAAASRPPLAALPSPVAANTGRKRMNDGTDNIIVDTATRIFQDLCEPATVNDAENGVWPKALWSA